MLMFARRQECVVRSYLGYYSGSHPNSADKRPWARIVLGWVTSREVLVSYPYFAPHLEREGMKRALPLSYEHVEGRKKGLYPKNGGSARSALKFFGMLIFDTHYGGARGARQNFLVSRALTPSRLLPTLNAHPKRPP